MSRAGGQRQRRLKDGAGEAACARLFFALWPEPGVQAALAAVAGEAQAECGGRVIARDNIHLTLYFIGSFPRARIERLKALAAGVAGTAFALEIVSLGYWRHNRILWAGTQHCPAALVTLVARLNKALAGAGFQPDERPYVPHVSLVRNAARKPQRLMLAPLCWEVRDFALVESKSVVGGVRYEVVERWPLMREG